MTFIDLFYLAMRPMFSGEKRKKKKKNQTCRIIAGSSTENVVVLIYAFLFLVLNKTTYVQNNPYVLSIQMQEKKYRVKCISSC